MAQSIKTADIRTPDDSADLRLGRISYLNVAPIYYGIDNGLPYSGIRLVSSPPSVLNGLMKEGKLDISPVSSAAYARNSRDWLILPDLSIACSGRVMSVRLASRYPLEDLNGRPVILTQDSEAAAALVQWIFSYYGIRPVFTTQSFSQPDDLPADAAAALVIGNAALSSKWDDCFDYVRDLGEMWKEITGLPFVFALWVVQREYAAKYPDRVLSVLELLHRSRAEGTHHIDDIAATASRELGLSMAAARLYYKCLYYSLGSNEMKGLEAYFNGLFREGLISDPAGIHFFEPHHLTGRICREQQIHQGPFCK